MNATLIIIQWNKILQKWPLWIMSTLRFGPYIYFVAKYHFKCGTYPCNGIFP